jgi:hypothetical protein
MVGFGIILVMLNLQVLLPDTLCTIKMNIREIG